MRLLFFTDTHIRGTTPKNRKDNFYETIKNKFNEIAVLCRELNIDYVLHGGDWFDRPDISPGIVRDFARLINNFERPIYTVAGNHDIYGHNPETIGRTMLGLLDGVGILKLIGLEDTILLEKGGIKLQLTGKPYRYDIDGENSKEYYVVKKPDGVDYAINIVHGMLLPKPFFEGVHYTLIEDILDTQADITLVGHYHSGFGVKNINSRFFANPGSLVRVTNYASEMRRMPKVLLIELAETVTISEIELKCALPGEEVLDRTQLEAANDRSEKLYQFYQGIAKSTEFKKIQLDSIIDEIASNQEIDKKVKDEAVRRISIARENFSKGIDD